MIVLNIVKLLGALATAATGFLALVKPASIYGFTGLTITGPRGTSEIRAIFGGLFIALGIAPFIYGEPAYSVLGFGYLGIALVRLFSIFLDKSRESSNWISLGIEIFLGILLVLRF